MSDGRVLPITDEELRRLPLPIACAIELVGFRPPVSATSSARAAAALRGWATGWFCSDRSRWYPPRWARAYSVETRFSPASL